jgi:hypothetical protein
LYKLSEQGKKVLEALANGKGFDVIMKHDEKAQELSNAANNISSNVAEATA